MPKSLIIISDMEFDYAGNKQWSFYDNMRSKFIEHGYEIPQIVWWNVESRHDVFHVDKNRKGVVICSGQGIGIFKNLIASINMTPVEFMLKCINSKRYEPVSLM